MNAERTISIAPDVQIRATSIKIVFGVAAIFACSQIAIPLEPVPITLQSVAIMVIGLLYPRRTAVTTVISYVALGGLGLPVFQNFHGGFTYLYGPTAGYLFGFALAVYLMSLLREQFGLASFWGILANCLLGTSVIFLCGVSWLAFAVGLQHAIAVGIAPFIIPGAIKTVLLSGALRFIGSDKFAHLGKRSL